MADHTSENHIVALLEGIKQTLQDLGGRLDSIEQRLDRLEEHLALSQVKETYTTEEAAQKLKRAEWTVRHWCNKGQVRGAKKVHGKGRTGEWRIPHAEFVRLQNEGPLPLNGGLRVAS
jgi:hypothetical protein